MGLKLSEFAAGEVMIFIDGERFDQPGYTKITVGWPNVGKNGEPPWVSITTDPDDETYRTPLLSESD